MGKELYLELETYFPTTWGKIPIFLKKQFTSDFEEGMHTLVTSEGISRQTPLLMRNMAEYFAGFQSFSDNNLYVRFLKETKSIMEVTKFSTLNYDLLFEDAAHRCGSFVTCFEEEVGKLFFLKIHGSCNFIPPKGLDMVGNTFEGYGSFIGYKLRNASREESISFCNSGTSVSPSMCMYSKLKRAQFAHSEINRIQDLWKRWVMNSDKILLIGIKWYKEDAHIWDTLTNAPGAIGFIGSKNSFEGWIGYGRNKMRSTYLGHQWYDSFDAGVDFLIN